MQVYIDKCYKNVAGVLECSACNVLCKKNGKTAGGKQRYKCKCCGKTFLESYNNKGCIVSGKAIIDLKKESCGMRSIARLLRISCTTVLKQIRLISRNIHRPALSVNKVYEVDELRTYYKNKGRLLWVVCALQRDTKAIVDFVVGRRTKGTVEKVISTLVLSNAKAICTDKLSLYGSLVPSEIHCTKQYSTNNIERKHLTLRTHLKRLQRKTICYSKSVVMLAACLKIYFWG